MFPLETPSPPPGDPSGGVVYLLIVLSPEESSSMWMFLNINVLQGGVVSTSPNLQAGGPPLVGCQQLFIQFIRSYPPYRRPFLYPQHENAPCRGDRDPLHGDSLETTNINSFHVGGHGQCSLSDWLRFSSHIQARTIICCNWRRLLSAHSNARVQCRAVQKVFL